MKRFKHCSVWTKLVFLGLFGLWLAYSGTVWATDPPTQGIVNQINNYSATGEIYESGAVEDLCSTLASVDSAIATGDHVGAQDLLASFMFSVRGLQDMLMSSTAASNLIDSANALSLSL